MYKKLLALVTWEKNERAESRHLNTEAVIQIYVMGK